jgi:hypothetical protein
MTDYIAPTRFCRNAEQFGDGTVAALKLHTNRPTWYLRDELPWMKRAELEAVIQAAADRWTDVCDFKAVKAANEASALWVFTVARMDGPGGTLADAMLPNGARQQVCRIDVAENALRNKLVTILCHEIGHLMGSQHWPIGAPHELMEPQLSNVTHPQPTEAGLMVQWYGPPVTKEPKPAPPATDGLSCVVRLADDGKTIGCNIEASKPGFTATLAGTKTWVAASPPQGIYEAPHQVQQIVIPPPFIEQDELADTDLDTGDLS